ncbi:MAG TPA: transglutaminase-like cysteine peptidase [Rhizomicrobium sp.]|nr:transglutaminase-like cysteine peptidase [Rhizomicrobium sp.]
MPLAALPPPAIVQPVELTRDNLNALESVQSRINAQIAFAPDIETYGQEEYWAVGETKGDCEDYALAKLKLLRRMGWPKGALDLAIGAYKGEWHTVLIVHTDQGDIALDNSRPRPINWRMLSGYDWLMTSVGGSFRTWRKIDA